MKKNNRKKKGVSVVDSSSVSPMAVVEAASADAPSPIKKKMDGQARKAVGELCSIECVICCNPFEGAEQVDPVRVPKFFPCGHSFCGGCIDGLILNASRNDSTEVNCPICRTPVNIEGEYSFPCNFTLMEIIKAAKSAALCDELRSVCADMRVYAAQLHAATVQANSVLAKTAANPALKGFSPASAASPGLRNSKRRRARQTRQALEKAALKAESLMPATLVMKKEEKAEETSRRRSSRLRKRRAAEMEENETEKAEKPEQKGKALQTTMEGKPGTAPETQHTRSVRPRLALGSVGRLLASTTAIPPSGITEARSIVNATFAELRAALDERERALLGSLVRVPMSPVKQTSVHKELKHALQEVYGAYDEAVTIGLRQRSSGNGARANLFPKDSSTPQATLEEKAEGKMEKAEEEEEESKMPIPEKAESMEVAETPTAHWDGSNLTETDDAVENTEAVSSQGEIQLPAAAGARSMVDRFGASGELTSAASGSIIRFPKLSSVLRSIGELGSFGDALAITYVPQDPDRDASQLTVRTHQCGSTVLDLKVALSQMIHVDRKNMHVCDIHANRVHTVLSDRQPLNSISPGSRTFVFEVSAPREKYYYIPVVHRIRRRGVDEHGRQLPAKCELFMDPFVLSIEKDSIPCSDIHLIMGKYVNRRYLKPDHRFEEDKELDRSKLPYTAGVANNSGIFTAMHRVRNDSLIFQCRELMESLIVDWQPCSVHKLDIKRHGVEL